MNFVRIFDDEDCLLSVKNDDEELNEFEKIFDQWTDIEYLENFFSTNENDLKRPFWEGITIEQAIIETRKEAIELRSNLKKLSEKPKKERISTFISFFQPLNKVQTKFNFLDKTKAYGKQKKSWLRIYALKAGEDMYIITGGAIKLTDNMEEREHTLKELKKLESFKRFLLDEGIFDEEGVIELLEL